TRGSSSTSNSASCSSTPSWSRAASFASSTVRPVVSTHSIFLATPLLLPSPRLVLRTGERPLRALAARARAVCTLVRLRRRLGDVLGLGLDRLGLLGRLDVPDDVWVV